MSELGDFLDKKQKEVLENENFLKWNKGNKLSDNGDPLIVFHGSINKYFDTINPEFYNGESHVFGGFYASSEIIDVNRNYAGYGADVLSRIGCMVDEINSILSYEDVDEWDHEILDKLDEETKEKIHSLYHGDSKITAETFSELSLPLENVEYYNEEDNKKNNYTRSNELDFSDIVKGIIIKERFANLGYVLPIFVKMEKPCYIGFGGYQSDEHETTRIQVFSNYDELEGYKQDEEDREMEFEYFEESEKIKENVTEKFNLSLENLNQELACMYMGSEISGEEFYNVIVEFLDDNDIEDYEEDLVDIIKNESEEFIEFDEDNDITDSAEGLYVKDNIMFDEESEEFINGKTLITTITDGLSLVSPYALEQFREKLSELTMDEESLVSMTEMMNILRGLEREPEVNDVIFEALSETFDGIVMNASEALENNWNNCFSGIFYETNHYIVFKEENVKNALYNNGKYSLSTANMVERRSKEAVKRDMSLSKTICQKHIDHLTSRWENAPNLELRPQDFFKTPATDAAIDIKNEVIYINEDRMTSKEKLEKTIIHETVGHFGLNKFIGNKANNLLNKVSRKYEKELKELNKIYPELSFNSPKDRMRLAEEFVAFKSEKYFKNDKFLTRAKNKIKELFLKSKESIGFDLKIKDEIFLTLKEGFDNIKKSKKKRKFNNN